MWVHVAVRRVANCYTPFAFTVCGRRGKLTCPCRCSVLHPAQLWLRSHDLFPLQDRLLLPLRRAVSRTQVRRQPLQQAEHLRLPVSLQANAAGPATAHPRVNLWCVVRKTLPEKFVSMPKSRERDASFLCTSWVAVANWINSAGVRYEVMHLSEGNKDLWSGTFWSSIEVDDLPHCIIGGLLTTAGWERSRNSASDFSRNLWTRHPKFSRLLKRHRNHRRWLICYAI